MSNSLIPKMNLAGVLSERGEITVKIVSKENAICLALYRVQNEPELSLGENDIWRNQDLNLSGYFHCITNKAVDQ